MEQDWEVQKAIRKILEEIQSSGHFKCTKEFSREGEAVELLERRGVVVKSERSEIPILYPGENYNRQSFSNERKLATEGNESFSASFWFKKWLKNPYVIGSVIGTVIGIFAGLLLSYFLN